ncbi:MAG: DUF2490 domain-containing protein [Maribacter sp.]|nr:DUF2490 domain-containing protein [Maribacter sp.]
MHNYTPGNIFRRGKFEWCSIVLVCLMFNLGFSQTESDIQSWSAIELKYKLNKKINFTLEGQWRLKENITITDQYFMQLAGEYELFKDFEIGLGLRYIRDNDTKGNIQGFENHFRWHIDGSYAYKLKRFKVKHRIRYQNKDELGITISEGDYIKHRLRFKSNLEYNFRKWKLDPKFSAEIFHRFEQGRKNEFYKYRLSIGTSYKMKQIGKLGLYYRFEKNFKRTLPEAFNIIEIKYTYEL